MSVDDFKAPKEASRGFRWGRVLLAVSLGLNFLVAGVVMGGMARNERPAPKESVGAVTAGPLTNAFDKADRDALRRAVQEQGVDLREARRQMDADVTRLIGALRAQPWDRAEMEEALAAMRTRFEERGRLGERLVIERLAEMTDTERAAFAQRLEDRGPRKGGGKTPPPPPQN
jgi:uncharacterized membrane protein